MNGDNPLTFCQGYVALAGTIAGLSYWFLIAAFAIGLAFGIVELIKKYHEARSRPARGTSSTLKDLIDALKGFIEALAKAPTWIALFGVGLVLFWVVANAIPDECKAEMGKPYASSKRNDSKAEAALNSASDLPYSRVNRSGDAEGGRNDDK